LRARAPTTIQIGVYALDCSPDCGNKLSPKYAVTEYARYVQVTNQPIPQAFKRKDAMGVPLGSVILPTLTSLFSTASGNVVDSTNKISLELIPDACFLPTPQRFKVIISLQAVCDKSAVNSAL